jgi:hypothetical protein
MRAIVKRMKDEKKTFQNKTIEKIISYAFLGNKGEKQT